MSNIYINEPQTNGKVCLKTTAGDIDIELWTKECPLTCRNFIQLCMEGYYIDTIFHRVVKGFIVQGGDPTGTGMGGESIYGEPFKDEFHDRLRFNRRGLVGMANAGPHDNGSQFFFTLGPAQDLNRKHTLFGKVVGNTIFNLVKLEEGEVDSAERPKYPQKIKGAEILSNPFTDIVPRTTPEERMQKKKKKEKKVNEAVATKNFKLLSFGDEVEEEEKDLLSTVQVKSSGKSAHDLAKDEKLSREPAVRKDELMRDEDNDEEEATTSGEKANLSTVRARLQNKRKERKKYNEEDADEQDPQKIFLEHLSKGEREKAEKLRDEQKKLKKELIRAIRGDKKVEEVVEEDIRPEAIQNYYEQRTAYIKKSKEAVKRIDKSAREAETMKMLDKFRGRLDKAKETMKPRAKAQKDEHDLAYEVDLKRKEEEDAEKEKAERMAAATEFLKSTTEPFGPSAPPPSDSEDKSKDDEEPKNELGPELHPKFDVEDYQEDSWMVHKFQPEEGSFLKEAKDANMKDSAMRGEEWFDISDPRNVLAKRRRGDTSAEMATTASAGPSKKPKIFA